MKHILKLWESTSNLIKIIIGIAALALFLPKISGVYNNYEDSKKESTTSTYGKYGILYLDERHWLSGENVICLKKFENYCQEVKEQCTEFFDSENLNNKEFISCIDKIKVNYELPSGGAFMFDIYAPPVEKSKTITDENKINFGDIYNSPFTNFEAIEKRWGTMPSEQKLITVRNVFQTGTTYDQFPDWMKNDPVILEIKEELQQINSDN